MTLDDLPIDELKQAVALKYTGDGAPVLIAKGHQERAEEIVRIAEEAGIPLCDNPALVDILSRIDVGEDIPKSLYVSVAYILAFAFEMACASHTNDRDNI